jgi:hypothetical protein
LLWLAQAGFALLHIGRLRTVAELDSPAPPIWPTVTALVPARNEEEAVAAALETRLADDYPALQLVAIDDRSTDGTGEAVARLAARDPRVVPVRIDGLPEGWLGKVHALAEGVKVATGEWLLISDADVHFASGGLRKAVAHCESEGLDFVALVPEFRSRSFVINVLWTVFMRILATFVDPAAVRDPDSRVAMGSGAFMLARRSVFERTGGFEHLRLETTDDISLGVMMKHAGARCDFANGRGIASISIYDGLGDFYRGVEKNAGALARAPFPLVAVTVLLAGVVELSPFAAIVSGIPVVRALGVLALVGATGAGVTSLWANTRMVLPALLWPVGWVLIASGILRAAWLLARRGGVMWRDTFYTRAQLIEGQRFRML